jgi:2-succinyl-6-hydroxy-2,4-cyclohexadiene-1-carboxylate synthase
MDTTVLHHRIIGSGYPVLFIHGFLENATMWDHLLPKINGIQAILVDLHGHGNSPTFSEKQLSIPEMAEAVGRIVSSNISNEYSIVGHSLGGYVALELGRGKIPPKQIVLLNSHPFADSPTKKKERSQVAKIVEIDSQRFIRQAIPNLFRDATNFSKEVAQLINDASQMLPKGIADATIAMRDRVERLDVFMEYADRLFVIQGKYDALIPFERMQEVTKKHGNHFTLLEEAGHMAHFEEKNLVIRLLNEFLK